MVAERPELLSVSDAARLFKVSEGTIRRWVHLGKLPALQIGGGVIRIPAPNVEALGCTNAIEGESR
jgi:excisionase family DNA binding protein